MRALLQICSYISLILSRRTTNRKKYLLIKIRTDLQQFSRGMCHAVLTVEAAVALPLFLFTVLSFCYLFQVMEFQIKLQSALNQTAEQAASYGYLLGRVTAVTEQKAEELGFEHFATTLTISPHKNSNVIQAIGEQFKGYTHYDFKKKDGYKRSIELSKELDLYRQCYCACEFSMNTNKREDN